MDGVKTHIRVIVSPSATRLYTVAQPLVDEHRPPVHESQTQLVLLSGKTSVGGGVSGGIVPTVLVGVDLSVGSVVDSSGASVKSISGAWGSSEEVSPMVPISGAVGLRCVGVLRLVLGGVVPMGVVMLPVRVVLLPLGTSSGAPPKFGISKLHNDVLQQTLIFRFRFSGTH